MTQNQNQNREQNHGSRRLRQFIICLLLFGLVLAGRGLDLAPVEKAAETVSRWVGADTDFRAVFAGVGESFSRGEPAAETFRVLWTGLIPGKGETPPEEDAQKDGEGTASDVG